MGRTVAVALCVLVLAMDLLGCVLVDLLGRVLVDLELVLDHALVVFVLLCVFFVLVLTASFVLPQLMLLSKGDF